jgi:uncharacterized membrane protein
MAQSRPTSLAHLAYLITISIKGLDGALETLAGLIIALAGKVRLYFFVLRITAPEIVNHPHAAMALRHGAQGLKNGSDTFLIVYLLVHGVLKLGIAAALLLERGKWIFPVAVVILGGFIAFMGYKLTIHWSNWLLAFALFDLLTVALVVNEWRTKGMK